MLKGQWEVTREALMRQLLQQAHDEMNPQHRLRVLSQEIHLQDCSLEDLPISSYKTKRLR